MKRILLLTLLLFHAALPARPHAHLRLATWNLHNFFDEWDDPGVHDTVLSHAEVETKLDTLTEAVRSIDADVLGVEEVENQPLLQRLAARVGGYQQALLVEGNDRFRGINVGLLSRVPILGYRTHRHEALPHGGHFSRDCLEVHLGGALPFVVLVNHFKSKAFGRQAVSDAKRRAQAEGVMRILPTVGPLAAVIGDLNDGPGSWPLEPLRPLVDPFGPLTMDQRYTLKFHGRLSCLDHILLTAGLSRYLVLGSPRVHRDEAVHRGSDHYAISLDLAY